MSRCFPFPPPGYEKKLRVEDVNLLAKEKRKDKKEKNHKKDKNKKKEKKEGREKDKERSQERHKEKDKERHKHKDKDKDKDRKNENKRSRLEESGRSNVEKVGSSSPQSPCVQELKQRISFVDGATGSLTVHNVYDRDQVKSEFSDRVVSRSNGGYWTEGKNGFDQSVNGQRENKQSNFPKVAIVFSNGTEQRTMQMGRLMENNVNKVAEGKDRNAKRHKGQAEICTPQTGGYNGALIDPPKKAAVAQEHGQRIRDENGTTGSHVSTKANVALPKTAQNSEKVANGFAISTSQPKENSKYGNGCYTTENGQENNLAKVPKVAIVHTFKLKETLCKVLGAVNMSKKAPREGIERNGYSEKGVVDNRKKIQVKDEDQNKLREEKVKNETGDMGRLPRFGQNGSDTVSSKQYTTLRMGDKSAGVIAGKRKEPEANGTLHDNDAQPNKWQRTVLSSQPGAGNGRQSKLSTTITLSASKQKSGNGFKHGDEHKTSWTVDAQSSPVTTKFPSASVDMDPSCVGTTTPSMSAKVNGKVVGPGLPLVPTKPQASIRSLPGTTDSQERSLASAKAPSTGVKANGTVGDHGSPTHTAHETVGCQEPAKPLSNSGNINGTIGDHRTRPSSSRKEKHKDNSSSKPRPPHPDTKYLSQILLVPKMEELSEFDDPEWLFKTHISSSKESDVVYDRDQEEQVWAKAVHLKSADVYALPYVIPY